MEEIENYIRVGTTLYKISQRPLLEGGYIETRIAWTYDTFKQDYKDKAKPNIKKYDGFCAVPSHVNYKRDIGKPPYIYYNEYELISHQPNEGDCPHILSFISHIFEEQNELGLDYMQLLYLHPEQKLPIILLVSPEGNTGKTTFLNLLKMIFENNVIFNTNEDFRSPFNGDWARKLIIAIDEALLDRREDAERIKNLSTAKYYKVEYKGKDRYETEFFAKFVLCANNDLDAIKISPHETRYWVRKVQEITESRKDSTILDKMKSEIPHFLHFLENRKFTTIKKSRMWFAPELLKTDALKRIIAYNQGTVEVEILKLFSELFSLSKKDELLYCSTDIQHFLNELDFEVSKTQLRNIFQNKLKIYPLKQQRYNYISGGNNGEILEEKRNGRPYLIKKELVDKLLLQ
ncbi:helicase [Dysgonomonas sp. HDW5B]|uniref:primase-helicase family protein n=1 Tax=Dysgonomonas sp. HDW5B TaxID=2714927 RepID=UPI00140B7A7A|nr:primase-helicase family protein [Dysgonomonas sp. HDW5B]QIK52921.1 helicase [Dysgonomonas sp. HDW5B]